MNVSYAYDSFETAACSRYISRFVGIESQQTLKGRSEIVRRHVLFIHRDSQKPDPYDFLA